MEETEVESVLQEWNFFGLLRADGDKNVEDAAWQGQNVRDWENPCSLHVLRRGDSSRFRRLYTQSLCLGLMQQSPLVEDPFSDVSTSCQCSTILCKSAGDKDIHWAHYGCDAGYMQEVGKSITWDIHWSKSGWASSLDCASSVLHNAVQNWWTSFTWRLCIKEWVTNGCEAE